MQDFGNCPHCKQLVDNVIIKETPAMYAEESTTYVSLAFVCPNPECFCILSMQINPISLAQGKLPEY